MIISNHILGDIMKLIWHGTASLELRNQKGALLFDPFVPMKHSNVSVSLDDFDGFSDIFITHGHFDHIEHLPQIVKRNPNVKIYCTDAPYKTLTRKGIQESNLIKISYGQTMDVNGFHINIIHGRHAILPKATLSRVYNYLRAPESGNLIHITSENFKCRENDETIFYYIESDGRSVSIMGSLNLRDEVSYPQNSDLLVLPYNGYDDNYPPAINVIKRLSPKRVVLDHFDNTFPPITGFIDLSPIINCSPAPVSALKLGEAVEI